MSAEEWRPVVGFEANYSVSNTGRVWSVPRFRAPGGELKPTARARSGHYSVNLWVDGVHSIRRIHQLVAEAFIGPRPEGMVTRHLDGNPANNSVSNLRYGTPAENTADMMRHGNSYWANRSECSRGHAYTPENTYITPRGRRVCRACQRIHGANRRSKRVKSLVNEATNALRRAAERQEH